MAVVKTRVGVALELPSDTRTYYLPAEMSPLVPRAGYNPVLGLLLYHAPGQEPGAGLRLEMTKLGPEMPLGGRLRGEAFLVEAADLEEPPPDPDLDAPGIVTLWVATLVET